MKTPTANLNNKTFILPTKKLNYFKIHYRKVTFCASQFIFTLIFLNKHTTSRRTNCDYIKASVPKYYVTVNNVSLFLFYSALLSSLMTLRGIN
jgi:hypothetical protein